MNSPVSDVKVALNDLKVVLTVPKGRLPQLLQDLQDFVSDCPCFMLTRYPQLTQLTQVDELSPQELIRLHYVICGKTFKPPKGYCCKCENCEGYY